MHEHNPNCCDCKGYCAHGGHDNDLRHLYCGYHARKRFAPKPLPRDAMTHPTYTKPPERPVFDFRDDEIAHDDYDPLLRGRR